MKIFGHTNGHIVTYSLLEVYSCMYTFICIQGKWARMRGISLTGEISPPDKDSTSAEDLEVYEVSVDSDPRDPRDVVDGTGSDHFLDTFSLKLPVRKNPDSFYH